MIRTVSATKIVGVLLCLGLALAPLAPAAETIQGWKEAAHDRMAQVEAGIAAAKQALASSPGDAAAQAVLCDLTAELDALSASLGGDRPGSRGREERSGRALPQAFLPPASCTATTSSFTQTVPVAIPTGPGVVTSTLVVSGAGPFLWDVNATTFITHTFSSDLDITLQSPAGTIVTLTSDNGSGNDNVFNGTVWDDSANPGGQVPYATNNGLVTDHAFVNLTLASPLVPEEAMAAFYGEDPNGTWTLTISDDLTGDGGSLDGWSLDLSTFTGPPTETLFAFGNATPLAIPTGPGVVNSTLAVSGAGAALSGLTLTTFITHTFASDLDMTLQSPAGTVVTITTDNGSGNDNVFNGTVWSDGANPAGQVPYTTNDGMVTDHLFANLTLASPLVPEELGAFMGEDPNGTWTLTISDDLTGDGGSLDSWSLDITTATCASCPAITLLPDPLPNGLLNAPYSQVITATGGTGSYTFAVTAGALPTGLALAPDGTLSGTPTVPGPFAFTVTATDAALCTGSVAYTMTICPLITLAPATLPGGLLGGAYSQVITATGGTGSYTFAVTSGALPDGLTLAPDGTLSGTPTASGPFSFTVTATDLSGCTGSASYIVVVAAFNMTFYDDTSRAFVCVNSTTGAFSYTILRGTGVGTHTGMGAITRINGLLTLTTPAGVPYSLTLRFYERYYKATASYTNSPLRIRSALNDSNTRNNPAACP